jgi:osmotically-inducible protein OsmY
MLLALACAASLAVFGCNRDYESDNDDTATDQYGDTTGTGVLPMDAGADDSAIKDSVQAQLRNDPRFEDVDIDVDDGIVTIDGKVASQADLDAVQMLVRQAQGVRDVKLNVQIEDENPPADPNNPNPTH